jgi:hypothetical protein
VVYYVCCTVIAELTVWLLLYFLVIFWKMNSKKNLGQWPIAVAAYITRDCYKIKYGIIVIAAHCKMCAMYVVRLLEHSQFRNDLV